MSRPAMGKYKRGIALKSGDAIMTGIMACPRLYHWHIKLTSQLRGLEVSGRLCDWRTIALGCVLQQCSILASVERRFVARIVLSATWLIVLLDNIVESTPYTGLGLHSPDPEPQCDRMHNGTSSPRPQ